MANDHQHSELPAIERLSIKEFSRKDAVAAIAGERIPALGLPLLRLCTIRGIRYHDGFGNELRGIPGEFTRALNARDIMSNRIPHMDAENDEEIPYCIWHPQVATEATYRDLAKRYPSMAYQIGRACAVAGYTTLYKELNLLPDVHIAEEAREGGSMEIYEHIMASPVKYSIMNDYRRTITSANPPQAQLNGDTAVRSYLDVKQQLGTAIVPKVINGKEYYGSGWKGYLDTTFNITEDMNIDTTDETMEQVDAVRQDVARSNLLIKLLTEPLPVDLPTVDKDLLICMAAYNGDIDRYVRLHRPKMVEAEIQCCVRGIYHNTMFAVWWSKQDLPEEGSVHLKRAMCARFIMNNILSKVAAQNHGLDLPYLIWYPELPRSTTCRKIAEMAPAMIPQAIRACIVANYEDIFDELVRNFQPDQAVLGEAERSPNPHYHKILLERVEAVGTKADIESWKLHDHRRLEVGGTSIQKSILLSGPLVASESLYNGLDVYAGNVHLMACLPEEWKISEGDEENMKRLNYDGWPPETEGVRS